MAETKAVSCPNCNKPAIKTGNEINCEFCDTEFVITKKNETQVKQFGRFEDLENRIKKLEGTASSSEPKQTESEEEDI